MFFHYHIDEHTILELQSPFHARELFDLVNENREFIGQHLSWVKKIERLADIKHYMQRDLLGMVNERRWAWLIRYKGQAAGRIGLFVTVPALQECELYYFLGRKFTGKGIITKAAKIIVDFAVNVLQLKHVLIGFNPNNPKSGAVAERLGFQHEVTMHDIENHKETWQSLHFWGILAENWQSKLAPNFNFELGDGLSLRLYQPFQSEIKFKLIKQNQAEFSKWFWWANDLTLGKAKENARRSLKRYAKKTELSLSIWQNDVMVGDATLSIDLKNNSGDVGYWLDKEARGKGIMTRTVRALFDEAFFNRRVERMGILAASENKASRAIAERLGMSLELIQADEIWINNRFVDHVQYGMLREEWKEKQL